MATARYTDAANAGVPSIYDAGSFFVPFTFTIPSAGLVISDTIRLIQIPGNSYFLDLYLSHPALEAGGPTLTVDIGNSTTQDAYVAAGDSNFVAAFNDWLQNCTNFVAQSIPAKFTTANYIVLTIKAAATTSPTSGTIKGYGLLTGGPYE